MFLNKSIVMSSVVVAVLATALGIQPAFAQVTPPAASNGVQIFNACNTTDYAAIAAKSLNMSAGVLRADLVKGQSLVQISSSVNVSFQMVSDALKAAQKTDIDQAVKDGVLTQDDAAKLESGTTSAATMPAAGTNGAGGPSLPGGGAGGFQPPDLSSLNRILPDISNLSILLLLNSGSTPALPNSGPGGNGGPGAGGFPGLGSNNGGFALTLFDRVKPFDVIAKTLNMKCADLVAGLIATKNQSIQTYVASKNGSLDTIGTALLTAYQTALTQDVTEQVLTQAQADQFKGNLTTAVNAFLSSGTPLNAQSLPIPSFQ